MVGNSVFIKEEVSDAKQIFVLSSSMKLCPDSLKKIPETTSGKFIKNQASAGKHH